MTATGRHDDVTAVSLVPPLAREFQGRRAGVVSRSLACAVDAAVVAALLGATYLGLVAVVLMWDPRNPHLPSLPRGVLLVAACCTAVLYLTLTWAATGRTYGNQLLGLRVVGPRGARMGFVRSLERAAVCVVFPIGVLLCAVTRRRRSVADILLRTAVLYDWTKHDAPEGSHLT